MSVTSPEQPTDDATSTAGATDVREFRKAPWRKPRPEALRELEITRELPVDNVNSLVRRVADQSADEIEHLITELQAARDILRGEADRLQRELLGYADMSQTAMTSIKVIGESVAKWKSSVDTARDSAKS
jgi:hypothetical protein